MLGKSFKRQCRAHPADRATGADQCVPVDLERGGHVGLVDVREIVIDVVLFPLVIGLLGLRWPSGPAAPIVYSISCCGAEFSGEVAVRKRCPCRLQPASQVGGFALAPNVALSGWTALT